MSIKTQYSGFKKINWENKTSIQKQKLINKHFTNLGLKTPKYISNNSNIRPKQLGNALQRIQNTYEKRINNLTFEKNARKPSFTKKLIKTYDKKLDQTLDKINSSNLTSMEKDYLFGKTLYIPRVRQKGFTKDIDVLSKIGNVTFSNEKSRIKFTKDLSKRLASINKFLDNGNESLFFKENASTKVFNNIINSEIIQQFSDTELNYLKRNFNALTPFEKELFARQRLTELRQRYELFSSEGDQIDTSSLYNGILYGMQNIARENRGVDLIDELFNR